MSLEKRHRPALDLRMSHSIHQLGDLAAFLTWWLEDGEPAMVLMAPGTRHARPCVVHLNNAHQWAEETNDDDSYAERMAAEFCADLGLNPLQRSNVYRIMSIVRDLLGDLTQMPPMPPWLNQKVGDLLVTDNTTGSVTHKEVSDHV
ncbi:hypothetical protein [Mesobacterium pallidum]|uniref:hypothetical protein n=1 Tax=Mesobacterium pallidum TaxID=2872037 RepID=UPI001EE1C065|nr:hypothetical protein [Mesobacterium pallidum]